jgi:lantibiotic biosynthesis protein
VTELVAGLDRTIAATDLDALADYAVLRGALEADALLPDPDARGPAALVAASELGITAELPPSLYSGRARIGWTVAHLSDGRDADAVCAVIDGTILRELARWPIDYDLISGLVGFGVYALERGPAGEPIARHVVAGLERYGASGWQTPPALLPAHHLVDAPDGYVNLGLAHGLAGTLALLARFWRAGIERERTRALIESALRRLLDGSPPRALGRFSPWQPALRPPSPRLAWCYGDLGTAAALLAVGLALDHGEAHREGLALARACAARGCEVTSELAICHGAAGAAHVFNRMAQATGDATLRAAAVRWTEHTLARLATARGDGASLLEGDAGLALVLHAACSELEPAWDRLLLLGL